MELIRDLGGTRLWIEVLVLLGCVGLAWLIARLLRGRQAHEDSVWFGRHVIDGLLFPALAVLLIYAARFAVAQHQHVTVLKLALPIFVSLAAIRFFGRVLQAAFPNSKSVRLFESWFSWMAWGVAVLWVTGLLPAVLDELEAIHFAFGKSRISLRTILEGALSSGGVLVAVLWLSATIERRLLSEAVDDLSMRKVAANALRAVLLLMGLLFTLSAVGVDLTALSVLGGAMGVGLGLGLQKLVANYLSGFMFLLERSTRIGDYVRLDNFEGIVIDIKTRYTLIRALNGRESVVPNELLMTQRVENHSSSGRKVQLVLPVSVGYGSDVDEVQRLLREAALSSSRVLRDPAPAAYLANLGADGLEFQLSVWFADPENGQLGLRSEINLAVLSRLNQAGIDIPYPQRVVHMKH